MTLSRMGLTFGLGMRPLGVVDGEQPAYERFIERLAADGGWFWDPTRADAMYQDNTAALPVSALDDPIGLILSVEKGLALTGPSLIYSNTQTTGAVTNNGNGTWTIGPATGFLRFFFDPYTQFVQGATYQIDFSTLNISGGNLTIDFCDGNSITVAPGQTGAFSCKGRRSVYDSTYRFVDLWVNNTGATVLASAPTLRRVDGAGLIQATNVNRPLFKQGAGALFDGSGDSLIGASALDLSGTDELMVIAGVRKLTDASRNLMASLSSVPGGNNGIFTLESPGSPTVGYRSFIKGTNAAQVDTGAIAAPDTAVLAIEGKISTDLARLRVDQGAWFNGSTDMGSGNFGNHVLYVGALGGSSAYLNGYITGLAVIPYVDTDLRQIAEKVMATLNQGLPT